MDDPAKAIVAISMFGSLAYSVRAIANAVVQYRRTPAGRGGVELSSAADDRLARLEHAVDAIAVEVERISEGQRFTTRLLSERARPGEAAESAAAKPSERNGIRAN